MQPNKHLPIYYIMGHRVTVVINYNTNTINIDSDIFDGQYPLTEFDQFRGSAQEFATCKLLNT